MNPKIIKNSILNEKYYFMKHPSGLNIYVYPKYHYQSSYAIFGTNFGSINNKFKVSNQSSYTCVPDGIAHYLEHKLFESPEGDAFSLFSKTGASANAYTSFEKTAYLFSCAKNFEASLEILVNLVQSPYFTEENVEKERGIISQEIKMYEDSPNWKVFINLLGALYHNNTVKIDIAGSTESISKITPKMLYDCYNAFYNLSNMCICVAGNVNPDNVFEVIDKKLKYSKPVKIERFFPEEPAHVSKNEIIEKFDIEGSIFNLGFKEYVDPGEICSIEKLVYNDLILNCISSQSSELYSDLLKNELINSSSFSTEYLEGPGYASVIFAGESKNPQKASEIIKSHIQKIHQTGIDELAFERAKKCVYGKSVAIFDNIKSIANLQLDFDLSGKEIFEYINLLQDATIFKANEHLKYKLNCNNAALSVAASKNGK